MKKEKRLYTVVLASGTEQELQLPYYATSEAEAKRLCAKDSGYAHSEAFLKCLKAYPAPNNEAS